MKRDAAIRRQKSLTSRSLGGFTLVELLVSIVLGLLLVAAATQLFTGGLIMARLQQGSAEVQDNGLFGLEYVTKYIRLANYDNVTNPALTDTTLWGGIVFTAKSSTSTAASLENLPANLGSSTAYISPGLLSHSYAANEAVSTAANEWKGLSNVTQKSDQLTIQFVAPAAMTNCEGVAVLAGDLVVQRYYIGQSGAATGVPNISNLALFCDANTPAAAAANVSSRPTIINGLGDAGQVIMPTVDQFHVLLVARQADGSLSYYTINQFKAATLAARSAVPALTPPRVVALKIGVLVRSLDNSRQQNVDPGKSFFLLDQTVTPNTTTDVSKNRFVRQAYTTTVALRNGFGEAL